MMTRYAKLLALTALVLLAACGSPTQIDQRQAIEAMIGSPGPGYWFQGAWLSQLVEIGSGQYYPTVVLFLPVTTVQSVILDGPVSMDPNDDVFVSWVYSTADTSVTAGEAGCARGDQTIFIDMNLQTGWNEIGINRKFDSVTYDISEIHISSIEDADLRFYYD